MKFEKLYLVDHRGTNSRIVLKFVHIDNGKQILCNTSTVIKILQMAEIQVQSKFSTKKFTSRYAKHNYRNLRSMKPGDPINIYHIPVSFNKEKNKYMIEFYKDSQDSSQ